MNTKVSIVVPVYGVEEYIEKCARSLFEQDFEDLEYIFVDDCTKDNSIIVLKEVIEDYPERKKNVRIIHHDINKGLPQARKTGMIAARGEYIANFDSDDWVDRSMISKMYNRAINEEADIVICDYYVTDGINKNIRIGCLHTDKEQLLKDLCPMRISWSVCNKMFKRSLLDESIIFPKDNMGEDMGLMLQLILKSSRFAYEPSALYYYYQNPNSITQIITEKAVVNKYRQHLSNTNIVIDAFVGYRLQEKYSNCIVSLKWNVRKGLWSLVHHQDYYRLWNETYPEIQHKIIFNNLITWQDKCRLILTILHLYPRRRYRI